jgi:CRISPR-associated protein Cas5t
MLRIEILQPNACYRIPQMGNPILTFPLAPPSTVFGLLRHITSYESINNNNTRVAISGIYESKIRHIVTNHITGISDKGNYKSNIIPTEELFQIKHIIHIKSDNNFEKKINENIHKAVRFGRSEDIITKITCHKIGGFEDSNFNYNIKNLNYYIYLPFNEFKELDALSVFNVPLDSDKHLLEQGILKMYFVKLLFLKIQKVVTKYKSKVNLDEDGYHYEWIN